jgi:sugar/nucleoside kinase (ribokinase family)
LAREGRDVRNSKELRFFKAILGEKLHDKIIDMEGTPEAIYEANKEVIEIVSKKIRQYQIKMVVVDPVMVSKSGTFLLRRNARDALIKELIPLAWVVTPNLMEASALTGLKVNSLEDMKKSRSSDL